MPAWLTSAKRTTSYRCFAVGSVQSHWRITLKDYLLQQEPCVAGVHFRSQVPQWRVVGEWLDEMGMFGIAPDERCFRMAINACEKVHHWAHALHILLSFSADVNIKPCVISFSSAISSCAKAAEWKSAHCLLRIMHEVAVLANIVSYSSAINACEKAHQWAHAISLLARLESLALEANRITYNSAISACSKGKHWEKACELLQDMSNLDIEPNVITLTALTCGFERIQQSGRATAWLKRCMSQRIVPDLMAYNATISASEKRQHWRQALNLFASMIETIVLPDVITFNAVISSFELSQWERAIAMFTILQNRQVLPNVVTYNAILGACEKNGKWQVAAAIWNSMTMDSVSPTLVTFNVALGAYEKGACWDKSLILLHELCMSNYMLNAATLSASLLALQHSGQWTLLAALTLSLAKRLFRMLPIDSSKQQSQDLRLVEIFYCHGFMESAVFGGPFWQRVVIVVSKALNELGYTFLQERSRLQDPVLELVFCFGVGSSRLILQAKDADPSIVERTGNHGREIYSQLLSQLVGVTQLNASVSNLPTWLCCELRSERGWFIRLPGEVAKYAQ